MRGAPLHVTGSYKVVATTDGCIQEDMRTYGAGYIIINTETDTVECTHMQLPTAIWTADKLTAAMLSLANEAKNVDVEDIEPRVLN